MTRLARRFLALCSIAGGGVLAASTPVLADPPAPTTTTTRSTSTAPTTSPGGPEVVRTGRATPPGDGTAVTLPAVAGSVRTGLAASPPAPVPAAPPAPVATAPPPSAPAPRSPVRTATTVSPAATGTDRPEPPPAAVATPPAAAPPEGVTHVVVAGDSLWTIATTAMASASGRAPTDLAPSDITPYWQRLCDLNRPRLRSRDVNLIFPGEVVALPSP